MAASYRVEVHKSLLGEKWANSYLIGAVDMDDAEATALAIVEFERRMHWDLILFNYMLISTILEDDRIFRHVAINLNGYAVAGANSYLPLYNTVRVDFSTVDSDPCRKYYRCPVLEPVQNNGLLEAANITLFNGYITTYFFGTVAGDNLWSPKGNLVVAGSVHPYVQMRQLHRRKRPVVA